MITSNLYTTDAMIEKETCPICGHKDHLLLWETYFDYRDTDEKEEQRDIIEESYYMCSECGYFHRGRSGGDSGVFSEYYVEGISIKDFDAGEYGPGIYSQIENLSMNRWQAVGYKIINHEKYEPDFYRQKILEAEEDEE